jgi:glycosyltransferase involved in cell wall biosynthesis
MPPGERLSILHVDLSKYFGGTERYCLDLAGRQLAQGHRVGLVAWRAPGSRNAIQRHAPSGLEIFEAPPVFASWTVRKAAREIRADILNAHLPDSARAVAAARLAVPAVLTMHLRYRKAETRGMAGLVFVARWQEREATGFPGLTVTAPNWPPGGLAADPARVAAARAEIGAGPATFVVGFIARLNRIKRAEILIDAFRRAGLTNARLALIGDGPDEAALKARAGGDPSIHFLGHRRDVETWHHAVDLFVLPSDWEGLPLGVLEAMRAGTPILATASQGTAEVLQGTDATLVPCGDTDALTAALVRLEGYFRTGALSRRAYDLSDFTPEKALARIDGFYRRVIAASGGDVAR